MALHSSHAENTQSQDEWPREGPFGAVFPKDFTSSNASDPKGGPRMGTILHYVLSLVKTVVVGAGLDSRAGEAAQARAAEVPGVWAPLQLPRPRAGEAV